MRKSLRPRWAGVLLARVALAHLQFLAARNPRMGSWSAQRQLGWAAYAYWMGDKRYAIETLMEIAEELINKDAQETFDTECQSPERREERHKREAGEEATAGAEEHPAFLNNSAKGDTKRGRKNNITTIG